MLKRIVLGLLALLAVVSIAGALWVRSVFTKDTVRQALAAQISAAIGQPVVVEGIGASFYPRVTVTLDGVSVGQPTRVHVKNLRLGTGLRALFSRQIVGGTVHLEGARIELPLPPLGGGSATASSGSGSPLEIVSIDEIVLNDVQVVSGGRTLRGDIVAVPHGDAVTLKSIALAAEDTRLTGDGEITNLAGPVGTLAIRAETLNFTRLLDFLTAFAAGSGYGGTTATAAAAPPAAPAPPPDITLALDAARATMGTLALERLKGRARATREGVAFDTIAFDVFGGRVTGSMAASTDDVPRVRLQADVSGMDVAALTAFAGSPGVLSGRLAGRVDLAARSPDVAGTIGSTAGTARIDIRDGVAKRLGLVKTIVIATSMRSGATVPSGGSSDEPFTRLGATLNVAGGSARTSDLQFESPSVLMRSAGSVRLDGSAIDLRGDVQLSEALTQQAGRDLVRYTQEQGRVTLPVTVTGSAAAPSVHVDVAAVAGRAIKNRVHEELQKGLNRLFKRVP
jgi:uncharacterized protein involved in outer membrane biogenesis